MGWHPKSCRCLWLAGCSFSTRGAGREKRQTERLTDETRERGLAVSFCSLQVNAHPPLASERNLSAQPTLIQPPGLSHSSPRARAQTPWGSNNPPFAELGAPTRKSLRRILAHSPACQHHTSKQGVCKSLWPFSGLMPPQVNIQPPAAERGPMTNTGQSQACCPLRPPSHPPTPQELPLSKSPVDSTSQPTPTEISSSCGPAKLN